MWRMDWQGGAASRQLGWGASEVVLGPDAGTLDQDVPLSRETNHRQESYFVRQDTIRREDLECGGGKARGSQANPSFWLGLPDRQGGRY